ncbi:response regulator transcription factor [Sphingobacterium lumbrici]|uniref:response regulator transcription factor n=1 Tax=Sphingobacterium lumbrici TaxID=2559600 RepID=UPI001127DD75|nr:response regulator transcription factor [Sphingobacterium lumbrici]
MRNKILLIEDDPGLAIPLKDYFEDNGLIVSHTISGEEGLLHYRDQKPDLIILDIILPNKSGFDVIAEIRDKDLITPIILMTGTEFDPDSQIKGYSLGALNFMQKPVMPQALLALIKNLLSLPSNIQQFQIGNTTICIHEQRIELNGKQFYVREKDARVFEFLLARKNQVVMRSLLLKQIWLDDHPDKNNLLDGSILRLRQILNKHPSPRIKSVYGRGYLLDTTSSQTCI